MNTKDKAITQIEDFLISDEKCMLVTGTHQYEKHKLIIRVLNSHFERHLMLFRTNSMQRAIDNTHLGWACKANKLKAGERIKVGKNTYECDSMFTESTWYKTSNKFTFAIVYPIDSFYRAGKFEAIDNLFNYKQISKIFFVSWTDSKDFSYLLFDKYISRHAVYDAQEEDPFYHQRVLDIINEVDRHY